jgi:2-hydroxyglutaryl-CoA dehydratase, D-component
MMPTLFQTVYANRDTVARAWKANGGRVVGVIGDAVPEELVAAAGFLPYRLSGDPDLPLTNVRRYLHASFNKGQSERPIRLGWVEAIIEKLLNGSYDFIDYLVIPYTRKEIAQVFGKLRDVARDYPQFRLPPAYLLDRAALGGERAIAYNRARLVEFRGQLEIWSGQPIDDEAMVRAIDSSNRSRALIAKMQALRGISISGVETLAILGTSMVMPRIDHNAALEQLLTGARPAVSGTRVFVGGSAPDTDTLYRCIEDAGGQVVSENHDWGQRIAEHPVSTVLPPFDAIADRYQCYTSALTFPVSKSVAESTARATAASADVAIFSVNADDGYQMFETPGEIAALGLPSLYLSEQPYRLDAIATTARIAAFLANPE